MVDTIHTDIPQNYFRTSAKALIFDSKKRFLLFCEEDGRWDLPGGGIDFGESVHDCIMREVKEEGGLEVNWVAQHPSYFYTSKHDNGSWKALVVYETRVKNLNFMPSDECVEVRFFTKEEAQHIHFFPGLPEFLNIFDSEKHANIVE